MSAFLRILGSVLVLGLFVAAPRWSAESAGSVGIVVAAEAPLYSAPEFGASVTATLPRGMEIEIKSSTGDLLEVSLSTGQRGWIPAGKVGLKIERNGRVCVQMGLEQALDEGVITADFSGGGRYRGESVAVTLTTSAEVGLDFCPTLRPGLVLTPSDGSRPGESRFQRMVVRSVVRPWDGAFAAFDAPEPSWEVGGEFGMNSEMVVGGSEGQKAGYLLEAYCMDADKNTPQLGLSLAPQLDLAPPQVVQILRDSKLAPDLLVLAVWAAVHEDTEGSAPRPLCARLSDLSDAKAEQLSAALEELGIDVDELLASACSEGDDLEAR